MSSNYACPCLNVQIHTHHPLSPSPSLPISDRHYQSVFVGQDGIVIVHPQLTLRIRTHSKPQSDSERLLRTHTSLTCLICRLPVYRVIQSIPPDMDVTEGPVLPTEDWVEHEVLQSESGWIELSKQCLTDESVVLSQNSEAYSPIFRVVLPTIPIPIPPPPSPPTSDPSSPELQTSITSPKVLPPLSPLFPPPPFVPSHPAFDHLSALALGRSDQLRKFSEEQLSGIVQARVLEIEKEEEELRRQVQLLWAASREAEAILTQETEPQSPDKRHTDSDSAVMTSPSTQATQGSKRVSLMAVRDFNPVSTVRTPSPTHDPYPSALSTSLAASSFHHPKASSEGRRSISPSAGTLSSPLPTSPTLVGSINYRDPTRRDMNENKDIATSFRYAVDMEAERETRARQYQSLSNTKSPRVNTRTTSDPHPAAPNVTTEHSGQTAGHSTSKTKASSEEPLSPSGSKGKRKVTFDIKPVAPSGERETKSGEESGEASVFELEDDNSDVSRRDTYDGPMLTLRDPIDSPTRPHRQPRAGGGRTLPQFLQTIRPTSLPTTVALRSSDLPRPESPARKDTTPPPATEDTVSVEEALGPRGQELARLVNVITPSHRNAWKKDSQSWKLFGAGNVGDTPPESPDNEADATAVSQGVEPNGKHAPINFGVSASLPISIAPSPRNHGEGGPPDDQHAKPEHPLPSASYRRASYAARDRSRSLDPGTLDFESGVDDDGIDADDGDAGSLSRGRRRALKILQARSELPDEGMWRSLAT